MADSSKDELLQLIKRVSAYLTVKMSNVFSIVFHKLDTRSASAIAGLAIAIVFYWRLLRSPNNAQRRIPKRPGARASSSGIDSQPNTTLMPAGISSPSEDSGAQNVVDNFFQPIKPTLAQIVRQKLFEARKVTCRLGGVILEESSPEELQVIYHFISSSMGHWSDFSRLIHSISGAEASNCKIFCAGSVVGDYKIL